MSPAGEAGPPRRRPLAVRRLGLVPYGEALGLQADLVVERRAGSVPDTLLLLRHPHVITLGSSSDPSHVLLSEAERAALGVELFEAGRGGDVTYHGPSQLVAYPILDLKPDRKDLHAYLRDLEDVLVGVAADYGVRAHRRDGLTGAWTERGKLAAIGVRVSSQWITSHGVALNVGADLGHFDAIVPCGLQDEAITSLERELDAPVDPEHVADTFARRFADRFGHDILVA